jgi:hypothetical protein
LIALTLNVYAVPAVRPVIVHEVEVEVGADDAHVPAAALAYAPPAADTCTV